MIEIIPNWHPLLVHFTLVFLVLCGLLQLALWWSKRLIGQPAVAVVQKWLIAMATVAVVATLATGLQAYYSVAHDTPSHLAMTDHRNWAFATATVFILGASVFYTVPGLRRSVAGVCFAAALMMVSVTAFKGADLVYRHGLGVMSLPQVSGAGHDHDHDHGDSREQSHHAHATEPAHHDHATGTDSEVGDTVRAFHTALNSGDTVKVRALLDDAVWVFERGRVERSADEYAAQHMKADMVFLQHMKITTLEHQIQVVGNVALSMSRKKIQGDYEGEAIDIDSMETMMLVKDTVAGASSPLPMPLAETNHWRIVHIHWSG